MNAEQWNQAYPPGTPVRYWPIRGDDEYLDTKTRSEAWNLGHGEPVVAIEGRSGGVCLSHCRPLQSPGPIEITVVVDPRERMTALARSFPLLAQADGLEPFDPEKIDAWAAGGPPGHRAGLLAARFVLTVWHGQSFAFGEQTYLKPRKPADLYPIRVASPWRCGLFDVVDALATWDAQHRAAFLGWAMNPWWP